MNAKLLLAATFLAVAALAEAEDSPAKAGVASSANARTEWNTNPAYWERVLSQKSDSHGLRIGKSGWVIKGPINDGIRRQRSTGERSTGERLLGLPIVRLFVPQPAALPPGGGGYLRWGESDRPWITIAGGSALGSDPSNPVTHEARTSLVSIGR